VTVTARRQAIYVISDSTGETGAKVVQAALLQFAHEQVNLRLFSNLRDPKALSDTVDKAAAEGALVVYTLVGAERRMVIHDRAAQYGVQAVDLLGPLMARLSRWLGESPAATPGLLHRLDDDYFRRIEAMEFAVKNDDGRLPRNFRLADMVVVGVSRTSKTPVSATLAQRGYKVANLPLVLGVPLPPEIEELDPQRVYGLTIAAPALFEIRRERVRHLGMKVPGNYADLRQIQRELAWAREVFREHPGWAVFDVTRRAVEETATDILAKHTERFGPQTI
jgi:regulator of PEP synthase PpsR (kinase-PPPase family)